MTELTNSQITQMLISQNEILQSLSSSKKTMTKTNLKKIKPSISFEEFVENIEILTTDKLINIPLPDYYAYIISHNLEKIKNPNDRPLVCADAKLKKYYYYSNGEWIKNSDFIKLLYNKIFKLVCQSFQKKNLSYREENCICISLFFNCDKYPFEKLIQKILVKLGSILPSPDDSDCD